MTVKALVETALLLIPLRLWEVSLVKTLYMMRSENELPSTRSVSAVSVGSERR